MDVAKLLGTYRFESSTNMDEYLKSLGVGLVLRKVQSVARPTCSISHKADSNEWVIVFDSVFQRKEDTFRVGEQFEDVTFDKRKCWSTVEILEDGKKMIWHQTCEEGPHVTTVIQVTNTGLQITHKAGDLACELKYVRGDIEPQQIIPMAAPVDAPQVPAI